MRNRPLSPLAKISSSLFSLSFPSANFPAPRTCNAKTRPHPPCLSGLQIVQLCLSLAFVGTWPLSAPLLLPRKKLARSRLMPLLPRPFRLPLATTFSGTQFSHQKRCDALQGRPPSITSGNISPLFPQYPYRGKPSCPHTPSILLSNIINIQAYKNSCKSL